MSFIRDALKNQSSLISSSLRISCNSTNNVETKQQQAGRGDFAILTCTIQQKNKRIKMVKTQYQKTSNTISTLSNQLTANNERKSPKNVAFKTLLINSYVCKTALIVPVKASFYNNFNFRENMLC